MDLKMLRVLVMLVVCLNFLDAKRRKQIAELQSHKRDLMQTVYMLKHQMADCNGMFMCDVEHDNMGYCISHHSVCDGHANCDDGTDEMNCPPKMAKCYYGQVLCPDGKTCAYLCNGIPECFSQIDELKCAKTCKKGEVVCSDGNCAVVGNGIDECPDKADEACPVCEVTPICAAGEVLCTLKSSKKLGCAPACNNEIDCWEGEDEFPVFPRCRLNCPATSIECKLESGITGCAVVCDSKRQCMDFDEELQIQLCTGIRTTCQSDISGLFSYRIPETNRVCFGCLRLNPVSGSGALICQGLN